MLVCYVEYRKELWIKNNIRLLIVQQNQSLLRAYLTLEKKISVIVLNMYYVSLSPVMQHYLMFFKLHSVFCFKNMLVKWCANTP